MNTCIMGLSLVGALSLTASAGAAIYAGMASLGSAVVVTDQFGNLQGPPLSPFDDFLGGVSVAGGDLDGDGFADVIVGSGPGGGPHVKVFNGRTGLVMQSFFAFDEGFTGGARVAAGRNIVNSDSQIVVGAGPGGGPHVKVFDARTGNTIHDFFAYTPAFTGGVSVASGDVDADGFADIITGTGSGGSHVKVFDGRTGAELRSFFAFEGFSGGVRVATGDLDGDGRAEIVAAAGPGGNSHVKVFDGVSNNLVASFFAYGDGFAGGVSVAVGDVDGDGRPELVTGALPPPGSTTASHVKVFNGPDFHRGGFSLRSEFFPFGTAFGGGVEVGVTVVPAPAGVSLGALAVLAAMRRRR